MDAGRRRGMHVRRASTGDIVPNKRAGDPSTSRTECTAALPAAFRRSELPRCEGLVARVYGAGPHRAP
jgi:hypothetical protein